MEGRGLVLIGDSGAKGGKGPELRYWGKENLRARGEA